ncbi:segregation and condensation protein A [Lichenicoccus roseus]|uniref:Segregation and condensation protein A n=1 Tax=Lichenicoccus roseus TaxID=2683649 RepID=A0A5R9J7H8_9PROT|nr:ScpA family protein [Lichenicoccus roseus]TLU72467.1 segregation/condensation protein A [Lichenicoccus roseus]
MLGQAPDAVAPGTEAGPACPLLVLDGYEGPLDLLLELARAQKVDLARISILRLVEQYLAVVEQSRAIRLELAADWLVMAAWLAWLKSRLLLPQEDEDAADGEEAAGLLQARLAELGHVGRAAGWLSGRDQLGHEVFCRGAAEELTEIDRSGLVLELPQLLGAYMAAMRRTARRRVYRPKPLAFWTVQDALARLRMLLGGDLPNWCALDSMLPDFIRAQAVTVGEGGGDNAQASRERRAAMAGMLIAGLELARSGALELRQEHAFSTILLRRADPAIIQEAAE